MSYLASLAVLARLVLATFPAEMASFSKSLSTLPVAIEATMRAPIAPDWIKGFARDTPILISGFGPDLPTAQEAALKLKEGAWLWTEAMSPEFALHGTPASYHAGTSAIVIAPELDDSGRSQLLVDVLKGLGCQTVARCGAGDAELGFAAPAHEFLRPFLTILPFHKLTAELARLRGTDPDTLHGHRHPWKAVMTGLRL